MTLAPRSASSIPAYGAAIRLPNSATRMPVSGRSDTFDDHADSLSDTDAHGGQTVTPARRRNSCTSVTRIRAPEAPSGWPMAMAPPLTFTLSGSRPSDRRLARLWEANASLISTTSRSPVVRPARASAFSEAGTGPIPHYVGVDSRRCRRDNAGQRSQTVVGESLLGCQQQCRRPVVHRRRVARCHGAPVFEDGLQRCELLQRRVGPRSFVVLDEVGHPAATISRRLDRLDLVVKTAGRRSLRGQADDCAVRRRPGLLW